MVVVVYVFWLGLVFFWWRRVGIANQQLVRSIDLYPDESMNKQNIRWNIFLSSKHFPRGMFPDFVIVIIAIVMARRISY